MDSALASLESFFEARRADFPILEIKVHGNPLTYLDNAATAQKPRHMIDATASFYASAYANVHRGVHHLSQTATDLYEHVRAKVQCVLNAASPDEIIFLKGCTEGINLVALCYAMPTLGPGDEIILSAMEHHSNIVPWQWVAERTGARIRVVPMFDNGELDMDAYRAMLNDNVKIVALVHVSNAIGTINPVKAMIAEAKRFGAVCLVDGAQSGPHCPVDVQDLGADFYTLSCHKMYAPTGVGVLYGRLELLKAMPPYQGGGSMIRSVTFEKTTYADLPDRYEPGTPNVAGIVGLGAALDYLASLGTEQGVVATDWSREQWVKAMARIADWESELVEYGMRRLNEVDGITQYGPHTHRAAILSFNVQGVHPHDVGHILDMEGVAIRVGHHCCQPLMQRLGVAATNRASMALYNSKADIDRLVGALQSVRGVFKL